MDVNDAENREHDRKQRAVQAARDVLESMGFDAVFVAGTYVNESGSTEMVSANSGNWHAQNGMMRYILDKRMHSARLEAQDQHEADRE